jgi:hypothetical protein
LLEEEESSITAGLSLLFSVALSTID